MRHYCTIFDKNYLFQGLALYNSLLKHTAGFELHVLCMDEHAYEVLSALGDPARLKLARDGDLRAAYPELAEHAGRTSRGQYIWSTQPFAVEYFLRKFSLPSVTYLEADSLFFSDPESLITEIGERSVSLVPHRYTPGVDQTETSGIYCVQFNFFRNNAAAKQVLGSWKSACLEYRADRPLNYPGQKDLDSWPSRFGNSVAVVGNLGAGVAPWNVEQFRITNTGGSPAVNGQAVVFYHFHEFSYLEGGGFDLGGYFLPATAVKSFYEPYAEALKEAEAQVAARFPDFKFRKLKARPAGFRGLLEVFKRRLRRRYNVLAHGRPA